MLVMMPSIKWAGGGCKRASKIFTFSILSLVTVAQWPIEFTDLLMAGAMSCWFESASVLVKFFHSWCKTK